MNQPRYKPARLALDNLRSFLKGWSFRLTYPDDTVRDIPNWHLLSDFPTKIQQRPELGQQNAGRLANMELACQLLDGIHIKPGFIFSMFKIIGDPLSSRGFQPGPMIGINGRDTTIGGGLCQISTALFNIALLAGCDVLEQHNHSKDIWGEARFVPLGKDAAYVFARWDLKFKNPFKTDLVLRMNVDRKEMSLNCQLWSAMPVPTQVDIRHTTLQEIPAIQANGTKGWVVLTERIVSGSITYRAVNRYQPT